MHRLFSDKARLASLLLSFGTAFLLLALASSELRFWHSGGPLFFIAFRYALLYAAPFFLVALWANGWRLTGLRLLPEGFAAALVIVFFSDWMNHRFAMLQAPDVRGLILLGAAGVLLLRRRQLPFPALPLLALACLLLFQQLLAAAHGRLLFSDDHAAVVYRLLLLRDNFPFIPFFNPLWNAGVDARDFFATGILNVFVLFAPLIYLFDPLQTYTALVGAVLFAVLPAALYVACRIEGEREAAPIAGLLALAASVNWYRWALRYGTMGFVLSSALIPLNAVLIAKLLDARRELSKGEAVLFVLSFSLMICWSLSGLALLPLFFGGTLLLRRVLRKRYVKQIVAGLLIINLPWMVLFLNVSPVASFVSLEAHSQSPQAENPIQSPPSPSLINTPSRPVRGIKQPSGSAIVAALREFGSRLNPVILLLVIPGIMALPSPASRRVFTVLALWLLLLGSAVANVKPQLELDRMLVIASLLFSLPAACAARRLLQLTQGSALSAALLGGFLIASPFAAALSVNNRRVEPYSFADNAITDVAAAIREFGGEGRTVFTGCVLHQLSGGHIAPLMYMTGKPLVASTPLHNIWWHTELVPPAFMNAGPEGIERYFDLLNATAVLAHEESWRKYFDSRPGGYEARWQGAGFKLYRRLNYESNYFLAGRGRVLSQNSNSVELELDSPEAVLKFNYFPFLKADRCRVEPAAADHGVQLVKLTACRPGTPILLSSRTGFGRIFGEQKR